MEEVRKPQYHKSRSANGSQLMLGRKHKIRPPGFITSGASGGNGAAAAAAAAGREGPWEKKGESLGHIELAIHLSE